MIVIDVETTGQVPWENSILSIGAVDFSNPSNQFYMECRMREGAIIEPGALERNGFTNDGITSSKKKLLKEVLEDFIEWASRISDMTLAGTNHYMDVYFIEHSLRLYNIKNPFTYRLIDTHTLVYTGMLLRGLEIPLKGNSSNINSDASLKYCGLPKEPNPHNALTGAKIEAESISRLIYGRNLLPEYKEFPVPEYLETKR